MGVMDKLKKNSRVGATDILSDSMLFKDKDVISTDVPMVNVALSGDMDGGMVSGLTVLAGPSKHFKTSFALLMGAAYLNKYEDAVMLFYDSEFGSPQNYFESFESESWNIKLVDTGLDTMTGGRIKRIEGRIPKCSREMRTRKKGNPFFSGP